MSADFAATLAILRQRFLDRSAADLASLLGFGAEGGAGEADLKFLVHRLAGAGATVGFPDISTAAALEAGWPPAGTLDRAALDPLIAALREAGVAPGAPPGDPEGT